MNIFISAHLYFPSKLGGPANTLYWLANAFVRQGHSVSVVTSHDSVDDTIPANSWIDVNNVRVFYSSNYGLLNSEFMRMSKEEIKKADCVLLNSFCFLPELILCLFALRHNKKVIWSPRGELSESAINKNLRKLLYFRLIKVLCRRKVVFHVTSDEEQQDAHRILGDTARTAVIPNLMELPMCLDVKSEGVTPYFLYLGRIAPIKSLDKILKGLALSRFFCSSPYKLKIVGDSEPKYADYHRSLIELIDNLGLKNKVIFEGSKFGQEKFEMLRNAKYLLLLSESENFGNVVIESLSQGTPVIASLGTPWEKLNSNNAGYWISNQPEQIAEILDSVFEQSSMEYDSMRDNALKLGREFNIDDNIYKWANLINNL